MPQRWRDGFRNERLAKPDEGVIVLDSGAVSRLAERSRQAAALIMALREEGLWPPVVPVVVLVECLQGHAGRDATANRFLKTCDITEGIAESVARRAALLRRKARRGSAVDALVVAYAEPGGIALTSDPHDLQALADHADGVSIEKL